MSNSKLSCSDLTTALAKPLPSFVMIFYGLTTSLPFYFPMSRLYSTVCSRCLCRPRTFRWLLDRDTGSLKIAKPLQMQRPECSQFSTCVVRADPSHAASATTRQRRDSHWHFKVVVMWSFSPSIFHYTPPSSVQGSLLYAAHVISHCK